MKPVKSILIVGGGTAGWMAAAAFAHAFQSKDIKITLVESPNIPIVGVGEATIPGIRDFNQSLGIDELEFVRATQATFKLGIEFEDWSKKGHSFFHPFANFGAALAGLDFHQCWQKAQSLGQAEPFDQYCFPIALAKHNKFAQPHPNPPTPLADYHYAFHFDAVLYAKFLQAYATSRGVEHHLATIAKVNQHSDGAIASLYLDSGEELSADFFIDCSGFKGLLIEESLSAGYEDWSDLLFCDRAVAVQCELRDELSPYTRSIARDCGWQWRIPLQSRVGNGYVYSSAHCSDEQAQQTLMQHLEAHATSDVKQFHFKAGRRKQVWLKNCFALGLASGFLEPLESTSISLIQTSIAKLLAFFPFDGLDLRAQKEVNRLVALEYERIRDFLVLHYWASQRDDSQFWRDYKNILLPETLEHKIDMFRYNGHLVFHEEETFKDASWLAMYSGFGIFPERYDARVDALPVDQLVAAVANMRRSIEQAAQGVSGHREFIQKHCS